MYMYVPLLSPLLLTFLPFSCFPSLPFFLTENAILCAVCVWLPVYLQALGTLKQKVRKYIREFESEVQAFRENPVSSEEEQAESGERTCRTGLDSHIHSQQTVCSILYIIYCDGTLQNVEMWLFNYDIEL